MFSLVLFAALLALLRAEERRSSRRIWLIVPLLALWSNLHGAVLLGLAVVLVYLATVRARSQPRSAALLAVAATASLCLNPALWHTVGYFQGLLSNGAAQTGQGMWAPLSPANPLDLILIICAAALVARARRGRATTWEWVAAAGLAVATVQASRNGVWLLFLLVAPAARARSRVPVPSGLAPIAAVAAACTLFAVVARGPVAQGASPAVVSRAIALAGSTPVLAADGIDEQVALAGGRIAVGNPIDAFPHTRQLAYLNWDAGRRSGQAALQLPVRVVVVPRGSAAESLMSERVGFQLVGGDRATAIYERTANANQPGRS
jgi:hypothetical protein